MMNMPKMFVNKNISVINVLFQWKEENTLANIIENNENIQCLKAQVNLYKKTLNEVNSKYEENTIQREKEEKEKEDSFNEQIKILEKKLDKIKNERSNLYSENKSLKNKLKAIEDTLKNFSNLIKKEDKLNIINADDQKEEIKYNNTIEVDKAINLNLNINNETKNYQNMRKKNFENYNGHLTPRSSNSKTSIKEIMYNNNDYNSLNHY